MRDDEPAPVRPHEHAIERRATPPLSAPPPANARCRRTVGSSPRPSTRSARSGSRRARGRSGRRRRRGGLVGGQVGPHLQRADRHVALRASGARPRTARAALRRRRPAPASGGALTRLRSSGAATPATTIPQAVALIAFDSRTGRGVYVARATGQRPSSEASAAPARTAAASHQRSTTELAGSASGCHCTPSTKCRVGQLDRLGQLVDRRDAADRQALAEPVHALVMVGLGRVRELAGGPRGERALAQHHVVLGAVEGAEHAPVLVWP